nr:MAG TPA: hypothetical protein [Caudoviricetes sp.]
MYSFICVLYGLIVNYSQYVDNYVGNCILIVDNYIKCG